MADANENRRGKIIASGIGLAIVLLLAVWLMGYFEGDDSLSDDPQVAELQRAIQAAGKKGSKDLKQQYAQLTPEQQQDFNMRKMQMGKPKHEEQLRNFFAQPEAEQWRRIDAKIDAVEAKRQQSGVGDGAKGNAQAGGAKKNARAANPQQIMAMKQEWTANASPELRAMMDRQIRMMNERRKQRGLGQL
jgi:hypothetical protein